AASEITIRITASVTEGDTASADVLIRVLDVNEAPAVPVVSGTVVAENTAGAVIGRVTASDPDAPGSSNGQLSFMVDDARFEIVSGV
ncbi:hypothetical protein WG926_26640, partial [Tistrella sp. BH-R2-4]